MYFDDLLDLHRFVWHTAFAELLIGLSPNANMPPSETGLMATIRDAGWYAETRDATTEMTHGAGIANEYGQGGYA